MTAGTRAQTFDSHWIGGRWLPSDATAGIDVLNPSDETRIATVPAGTVTDARRAVVAAGEAFPRWSTTPLTERLRFLERLVARLQERADELADTITAEVGAPTTMARRAQVGLTIGLAASYLDITAGFAFERRVGNSLIVREPAGVVASITPWNMPLLLTVQKIVPALMAGCTVVHKPSELTPLHAYLLAEIIAECDLPPGVFNLVIGTGPVVGAELASNPGVDLISLTGSTRSGREVARLAADTVKRVHLELGGKNASALLDDADLPLAVRATVDQMCFNTGQTCLQWSRLLVPADRHDEAVRLAAEIAERYSIGDPRDPSTDLGPLVSAEALDRVRGYIQQGIAEGARLITGGPDRPVALDRGYYVRPTVFGAVNESSAIARKEIFGPVLAIIPYHGADEAVRIINDTPYGLHGVVWSANLNRAKSFARRIRSGVIDINGGQFNILAPFGGFKQSGIGRECGIEGLDGFCEIKSLQFPESQDEPTGPRLRGEA